MASEIESRGLIFELQWKKKPGLPNKEEDIASLGIWDTADPSLDWCTFKSYLSQNLGTRDDISVAYVDSEGDELPIESECEFQEALKFARERSRKGRKIVLKVDKQECPNQPTVARTDKKRALKLKHARGIKLTDKFNHSFDFIQPKLVGLPEKGSSASEDNLKSIKQVLTKDLEDLQKYNKILMEKIERMSKLEEERRKLEDERRKKHKTDKDDLPPPWFKKYMQKMKHEIVTEVTANTRQMMGSMMANNGYRSGETSGGGYVATKVKRRSSDEESSDAALGSDQRDHKLLRKIEKLHKREKKLEKKLDSKLEKLENKTKRMMEKKSQSKPLAAERDRMPERKTARKRSSDGPVGTYLMDAILLNHGPKAETHIKLGKRFTKIWEIMNNGTLPWTDKTELRLAWGTLGLEPEEPSVKCPILEPGEKGQIAVNFRAPDFSGTFESYWHFYHMGERFGHWIGCAVVVEEPNKSEKSDTGSLDQKSNDVLKKAKIKSEKLNDEKLEMLDNIASSTKECAPNDVKRFNDAANIHHIHNIEVETNQKGDIVVDVSIKSKSEQISNLLRNLPNNNNINESPDQQKASLMGDAKVPPPHSRGPEYDSDSDDDNLSIISGAGQSASESDSDDEEDENFVVVPMPACFDIPASKPGPEDQKVQAEKQPRGDEAYRFGSFEVTVDDGAVAAGTASSGPAPFFRFSATTKTETKSENTETPEEAEKWWDSEDFKSDVYAVDSQGSCIPVAHAWPADGSTKIPLGFEARRPTPPAPPPSSTTPDATFSQSYSSQSQPMPGRPTPPTPPPSSTTPDATFSQSYSFSQSQPTPGRPTPPAPPPSSKTPDATFSQSYSFSQSQTTTHASPATSVFTFTTPHVPVDSAVHILPETIVNGAINVASSAYSTARAVLSNLRVKSPGEVIDGQCTGPRSTTENLRLLSEMGFLNVTQNVLLLQRFNNDIGKVVAELLNKQSQ